MTPIFLGKGSLRRILLVGVCVWAMAAAQSRRPTKTRAARTVPETSVGTATWTDKNNTHVWSDSGNWSTSPTSGVVPGVGSGVDYDVTVSNVNPPNNCMDDVSAQLNNLTIAPGIGVWVQNGQTMTLDGTSLGGNLVLQNTKTGVGVLVNLIISGTLTYMSQAYPAPGLQMFGNSNIYGGGTLINQGIISYGVGSAGGSGYIGLDGDLTLQNNNLVYAGQNSPLYLNPNAKWTNSGTIQAGAPQIASNGSQVFVEGGTITQTGAGQLLASPGNVTLGGCTISGGQLAAAGGGQFYAAAPQVNGAPGFPTLANLTIATGTPYTIPNALSTDLVGTITHNGTINVVTTNPTGPISNLNMNGAVTLAGGGLVVLAGPNTQITGSSLINQVAIQGVGEIKVDQVTNQGTIAAGPGAQGDETLIIIPGSSGFTNTGNLITLSGTAILEISGRSVNNAGGYISSGAGTVIFQNGVKIQGGTLSGGGPSGGLMEGKSVTLDGTASPVTLLGTFTVNSGDKTILKGKITDGGEINEVGSPSNAVISIAGDAVLDGTGALIMGNLSTQNQISGANSTSKLTVNIPLLGGSGTIDNLKLTIGKNSTLSSGSDPPLILGPGSTTQVNGTVSVPISTSLVDQGTLSNCIGGTTLSGAAWNITGTFQANCEVNTNSANITLTYPGAMQDLSGKSMFTNFTSNSSTGKLTLAGGQFFQTPVFTDGGVVDVQPSNTWSIAGGGDYNKTGGTLTNDGTIEAGSYNATGGITQGTGTWQGNVQIGSTLTNTITFIAGDNANSPGTATVTGSYNSLSNAVYKVPVTVVNGNLVCGQLKTTGSIGFQGALQIHLVAGSVPSIGQSCTIADSSESITLNFSKIEGLTINSTEKFKVVQSASTLQLQVDPSTLRLLRAAGSQEEVHH